MIYKTLKPEDRAQAIRDRLRMIEAQHFSLGLRLQTDLPGGDPEEDARTYDQLERHIQELHKQLEDNNG